MNLSLDILTLMFLTGKNLNKATKLIDAINHQNMLETVNALRDQAIILNAYAETPEVFKYKVDNNFSLIFDYGYKQYLTAIENSSEVSATSIDFDEISHTDNKDYNKNMSPYTMQTLYKAVEAINAGTEDSFTFNTRHTDFEKHVLDYIKKNINEIRTYTHIVIPGENSKGEFGMFGKFDISNMPDKSLQMFDGILHYIKNTYCYARNGVKQGRVITLLMNHLNNLSIGKRDSKIFGYNFNVLKENENINIKALYNNNYLTIVNKPQYAGEYCSILRDQCKSVLGQSTVKGDISLSGDIKDALADDIIEKLSSSLNENDDSSDSLNDDYDITNRLFKKNYYDEETETMYHNPEYDEFKNFINSCKPALVTMSKNNNASIKTLLKLYLVSKESSVERWTEIYNLVNTGEYQTLTADELIHISNDLYSLGIIGCNIYSTEMFIDELSDNSYITVSQIDTTTVQNKVKETAHRISRAVESYANRFNIKGGVNK